MRARFPHGWMLPWLVSLGFLLPSPTSAAPDIRFAATNLNFGSCNVGQTCLSPISVFNDGTAQLRVTGLQHSAGSDFGNINVTGDLICDAPASGQTTRQCDFTITFTPTAAGTRNGTVTVSSNDPDENPVALNITGTGAGGGTPDIRFSTTNLNFGSCNVGTTCLSPISVFNDGNAQLRVTGLAHSSGSDFGNINITGDLLCDAPALGQTTRQCDFTITFTPTVAGARNGTVTVSSNDPDENLVVLNITGTGMGGGGGAPSIRFATTNLQFGSCPVFTTCRSPISIFNDGSTTLEVTGLQPTGDFGNVNVQGRLLVPAGGQGDFDLTFTPSRVETRNGTITVISNDPAQPSSVLNITGTGVALGLPTRGLWVQFDRRGWAAEWWPGQVIQQFNDFDPVIGSKVSDEVALQLDQMLAMGVNTISYELRAADSATILGPPVPPGCNVNLALGFQWPQPTQTELTNLAAFLNLIHSKGMRVILVLNNTHMEEQPPTKSQTWLGAILGVVKDHPALDLVVFGGDARLVDTNGDGVPDSCGIPAEAPLWLGPTAVPATYVKWSIAYAMSLGLPASKLSVEAIVGNFFVESQPPAGPEATGRHLWSPVAVLKRIFDDLGIPDAQRTYGLSFYQQRKCLTAQHLPCVDVDQPTWAEQTLQGVFATIGTGNGARVVAIEMGHHVPVESGWSTQQALASLVSLMKKYNVGGGSFWRWVNFDNDEDADPALAQPIKRRGVGFVYNPVKETLVQAYK